MFSHKLPLIFLIFLTMSGYAQDGPSALGYFADQNQALINGYIDFDSDFETPFQVSLNYYEDFIPGRFYHRSGSVSKGYIRLHPTKDNILFSESRDGHFKNHKAKNLAYFTMGLDSFVVHEIANGPKFVGVAYENPEMIVFKQFEVYNFKPVAYYIRKKDSDEMLVLPRTEKAMQKQARDLFGDYPKLLSRIESGSIASDDTNLIVSLAEYYSKFKNNTKLNFTKEWFETKDPSKGVFYGVIAGLESDSLWNVTYHDQNGKRVHEAVYSSLEPLKKEGLAKWYHQDEKIRKVARYIHNQPDSLITEYYTDGKVHWSTSREEDFLKFHQIWDYNGNELLVEGNGSESFEDPFMKRTLHRRYEAHRLVESYYVQDNQRIYQIAEKNAKLQSTYQNDILKVLDYSEIGLLNMVEGTLLLRVVIDPSGKASELEILKGIENSIDKKVLGIFSNMKYSKMWRPGKVGKEKVYQEVIVPITFNINSRYRPIRNYNDLWFMHDFHNHWMMTAPSLDHVNVPTFPR